MLEEIINKLEIKVAKFFENDSTGHDFYHLKRTMNIALHINEQEGGDRIVIGVAAFVHDVHRILFKNNNKYCTPKESLETILELISDLDLSKGQIEHILHCVEFHEEYDFSDTGKTANDIETLILQDADNLDAIGAIGIARTFTFGASHNRDMYNPDVPFDREIYNEEEDINVDPSTIHHFHSKLLKLNNNMNTKTGKMMALKRHDFMKLYFDTFLDEWKGNS